MKKILVAFFIVFTAEMYSQLSVSARHVGKVKKIKSETLNRFKDSKTIVILPQVYSTEEYEKVFNEVWNVTFYELVNRRDFNLKNYLEGNYSFLELTSPPPISKPLIGDGEAISDSPSAFVLDLFLLKKEKIKKIKKRIKSNNSGKRKNYKLRQLFFMYRNPIAMVHLYVDNITFRESIKQIEKYRSEKRLPMISFASLGDEDAENFGKIIDKKNIFYNFKLGYLKNYLQKINKCISEDRNYWLYENDFDVELKNLATRKLFVPEHILYESASFYPPNVPFVSRRNDNIPDRKIKVIEKLFEKYEFDYVKIEEQELNQKILEGEELYYLNYVPTMGGERFLQIINSKTGKDVYREYLTSFTFNIGVNEKNIKRLNKKIKKAIKS